MSNKLIKSINRMSKLFQPIKAFPKEAIIKHDGKSKSYRLLLDMGVIRQANPGMYTLLPLGYRVLDKLIAIVDNEMTNIGAQKMLLPHLTSAKLWKKTGRLSEMGPELIKLKDRHCDTLILSPTYEEAITSLIVKVGSIQKSQLPLLLYQISTKWRDEMKPRLGLFRSREFVMKDLYSFDLTIENAKETYESVNQAYNNILSHIGVPYTVVLGDPGLMGGNLSHEYHYFSDIGEDTILSCNSCGINVNATMSNKSSCDNCGKQFTEHMGVEIAHTFLLGNKYTKAFQASCHVQDSQVYFEMGCYGLGLTRLITAAVEILSTHECLRWPKCIAPFTVCIIPPKEKSKESPAFHYTDKIVDILDKKNIDFIIDDRINLTIGRRLLDAKKTGYPYLIVIGKNSIQPNPLFEIHDLNNSQESNISLDQLLDFFNNVNVDDEKIKQAIV
ncbi:probable proline--tRNA ligase, mitochondrial [Microplitis demolitor]|uniref:probable proline--tRNA ligase, mitochondrial n=1 Tax=Microplitis demolitor TaxID=69319 RepID=UPI0004CCEE2C|nr:probable proline--tRNA ligase, mitochondrial [Microplitis demolitor]